MRIEGYYLLNPDTEVKVDFETNDNEIILISVAGIFNPKDHFKRDSLQQLKKQINEDIKNNWEQWIEDHKQSNNYYLGK